MLILEWLRDVLYTIRGIFRDVAYECSYIPLLDEPLTNLFEDIAWWFGRAALYIDYFNVDLTAALDDALARIRAVIRDLNALRREILDALDDLWNDTLDAIAELQQDILDDLDDLWDDTLDRIADTRRSIESWARNLVDDLRDELGLRIDALRQRLDALPSLATIYEFILDNLLAQARSNRDALLARLGSIIEALW